MLATITNVCETMRRGGKKRKTEWLQAVSRRRISEESRSFSKEDVALALTVKRE